MKPFWLKRGTPPAINARVETLTSSAMSREAQRCLIPASGFYEWRGSNRQPVHIRLRDVQLFAFAGLWLPALKHGGSGLPTAAIVTTRPNALMATIHSRMPAILRPEDELKWLDPNVSQEAQQLPRDPIASEAMEAYAGNVWSEMPRSRLSWRKLLVPERISSTASARNSGG